MENMSVNEGFLSVFRITNYKLKQSDFSKIFLLLVSSLVDYKVKFKILGEICSYTIEFSKKLSQNGTIKYENFY